MLPQIIPGVPIYSYGVAILIGFLLALKYAVKKAGDFNLDKNYLFDVSITSVLIGFLGAKITYILQTKSGYQAFNITDGGMNALGAISGVIPLFFMQKEENDAFLSWKTVKILMLVLVLSIIGARALYLILNYEEYGKPLIMELRAGFVLYGGTLGVLAGVGYTFFKRRADLPRYLDVIAPALMIGLCLGRIGCFMNGCCYGTPTDSAIGVTYPAGSIAYEESEGPPGPRHPVQLYESAVALGLFFFLNWKMKKNPPAGSVMMWLCLTYPVWRFLAEGYFRGDNKHEAGLFGMTFSQTVSAFIFAGGLYAYYFIFTVKKPAQPQQTK